jgi:hypothetical protein
MLALISAGWGPGCLSHAGIALINDVYRVETFALDAITRDQVGKLHSLCHHAPLHNEWKESDLIEAAARALKLAQRDERAALITPSGPISATIWPVVREAAATLGVPVVVAHGLGLAESMATCLQLPVLPTVDMRDSLSDFAVVTCLPELVVATHIGNLADVSTLYEGHVCLYKVNLATRHVQAVSLEAPPPATTHDLYVATRHMFQHADDASKSEGQDVSDVLSSQADWVELFNNLTEAIRD